MAGKPKPQTKERLLSHVKVLPNGCWEWQGTILTTGYGQIWWRGKPKQAHRVSFELFIEKIADGKQLDHLCRNRRCVSPEHLEQISCKENLHRGNTVAALNAKKKKCIRKHKLSGKNLYVTPDGRRQCKTCLAIHKKRYYDRTALVL